MRDDGQIYDVNCRIDVCKNVCHARFRDGQLKNRICQWAVKREVTAISDN